MGCVASLSRVSSVWLKWICSTWPRFRYGELAGTAYVVPSAMWTFCRPLTEALSPRARIIALSKPSTLMLPLGAKLPLLYSGIHLSFTATLAYGQNGSLGGMSLITMFWSGGSFGA